MPLQGNSKPGQVDIKIVLDGGVYVGKSVLLNSLKTGRYIMMPPTIGAAFCSHQITIKDETYRAGIWDTNGLLRSHYQLNVQYCRSAGVLLLCFAIDKASSLNEIVCDRIPNLREHFPETPIVLVATKGDLRNASNYKHDLFPLPCGSALAQLVGAVKYVECSAKLNQSVQEVFQEAVRASFLKLYPGIVNDSLHRLIKDNVRESLAVEWSEVVESADLRRICPPLDPLLQEHIEHLDLMLLQMASKGISIDDICQIRLLELTNLALTRGCHYSQVFTEVKNATGDCAVWYTAGSTMEDLPESVCQPSCDIEALEMHLCDAKTRSCVMSLRFVEQDCSLISKLFAKCKPVLTKSVVICNCTGTLILTFLPTLQGVESLIVVGTKVDITTFFISPQISQTLKYLVLAHCGIEAEDVPSEIRKLSNLRVLNVSGNQFKKLPVELCCLTKLNTLLIDCDGIMFPPPQVMRQSAQQIIQYLEAIQDNPTLNKEAKLVVVGQEGVGKSTLIKGMRRDYWIGRIEPPPKTDGVVVSTLPLKGIRCKVYDLAGDVEYLNTHSLFLTSYCLHLAVFDLSQFVVSGETRSADQLSRLEMWLQTIGSQAPKSYVNIVGTHADHHLVSKEILAITRKLVAQLLEKFRPAHFASFQWNSDEKCVVCNPDMLPDELVSKEFSGSTCVSSSCIPHVLGYFEVSCLMKYPHAHLSTTNQNLDALKCATASSLSVIIKETGNERIPIKWLSFRKEIFQILSTNHALKQEPLLSLSDFHSLALNCGLFRDEKVKAMLRFFHSQGEFLWYEEFPQMKDLVIIDPPWLSKQLITLISYRPSVDVISDGVLSVSDLDIVWSHISEEIRPKLLSLIRSVGLCFSISDKQELFPCNLPLGWPDREMWPPGPNPSENQTSLLFLFSFIPPSFFPDLIVAVNSKRESFAVNVKPLYYRFHIVYIMKICEMPPCALHGLDLLRTKVGDASETYTTRAKLHYTVHYELMPYNNSLKVTIRGPSPCCVVLDIRATVASVQSRRYPGVTYKEFLLCSECELKKLHNPSTFGFEQSHDGVCSKGHKVGSTDDILSGKLSSSVVVPGAVWQAGRVVGETLEDRHCPKLFVVLPINLEGLSPVDRLVHCYVRDGYAVHLLCECPDQWHFVDSPGFRVGKPKAFFEKYGSRVCKLLRVMSVLESPLQAAATLDPHCKAASAAARGAGLLASGLESLLETYVEKYPHLKGSCSSSTNDLTDLKSSSGLQRSELARFLEVAAVGRNFGPLVCTYVDKFGEWLWLCEEHNQRFQIVQP